MDLFKGKAVYLIIAFNVVFAGNVVLWAIAAHYGNFLVSQITNHLPTEIRELDNKIEKLDNKLDNKIEKLDNKLDNKIEKLDNKLEKLDNKLDEIKDILIEKQIN